MTPQEKKSSNNVNGGEKEKGGQNIVKIGDFSIYEDVDDDDFEDEANPNDSCTVPLSDKFLEVIKSVEQENCKKTNTLSCLICNKGRLSTTDVLKFKTLDEFFIYMEYHLQKYPEENNQEIAKNLEDFNILKSNLKDNYDKYIEYNFKSHRYFCRLCFTSLIIQTGGFNRIYKSLNVNTRVLKNNSANKKPTSEENEQSYKEDEVEFSETGTKDEQEKSIDPKSGISNF